MAPLEHIMHQYKHHANISITNLEICLILEQGLQVLNIFQQQCLLFQQHLPQVLFHLIYFPDIQLVLHHSKQPSSFLALPDCAIRAVG